MSKKKVFLVSHSVVSEPTTQNVKRLTIIKKNERNKLENIKIQKVM